MSELESFDIDELLFGKSTGVNYVLEVFGVVFGVVIPVGVAAFVIIAFFVSNTPFDPFILLFLIFPALIFIAWLRVLLKKYLPGPKWRVMAEAETWRMGDTVTLQWNALNGEEGVKSLRIDLEKYEVAVDTSGSGVARHRKKTRLKKIAKGIEGYEITSGTRSVTLPAAMPPTFTGSRNHVIWVILMTAKMKWFLSVRREFKVTILPPPVDETALPPAATETTDPFSETTPAAGPLTIRTAGNRTHFLPGEEISGRVTWQCDRPDDRVELRLLWFTQGKGDQDQTVVERLSLDAAAERGTFRLSVPNDAPCSFSGKFVAVVWALELAVMPSEAVQKERGFFQGKLKENTSRLELVISPTGDELIYQPHQTYAS